MRFGWATAAAIVIGFVLIVLPLMFRSDGTDDLEVTVVPNWLHLSGYAVLAVGVLMLIRVIRKRR
ncbi:hypothetical protein SAMN04488012_10110 [Palleronia salina]|uniref:Uncharacterized protein n=2 Tax=Palleronia TaxID=315422 RepID=A0A1M6A6R7_9RHOB|nr:MULTISPECIES: hypothetical protein [Palleronia]SEN66355.1 hypothetical protein SAMN04488011_105189 [Palleronia pelagia]SHI32160.1 hypothetical protein SAMN04488012_10110 [Palleronia salina]